MENNKQYYIISLKHTGTRQNIFTFWKPNDHGYCQIIEQAGLYAKNEYNR